jgi:uroporphyrinogen decarboxylase
MSTMTKRERLEATFRGEPVDRPPVALWRHWPGDDERPEDLARAHAAFQSYYDFDFIKVTPSPTYAVQDWGVESEYMGNIEGTREYRRYVIQNPEDWAKLPVLDPTRGQWGGMLRCLELLGRRMNGRVPYIHTVFNPLTVARNLIGPDRLLVHLRRYPDALQQGLETITETIVRFVGHVMKTGAAGIFLAVQHAQYGLLSEQEFRTFSRPYDLRVLEATEGSWFNLLHLHGNDVMFDVLADYPVQVINWHDRETPPSLSEALQRFPGAVCGGIRQIDTMLRGTPEQVQAEAADAIRQTGGRRFILGTGCVTQVASPSGNIMAARRAAEPEGAA